MKRVSWFEILLVTGILAISAYVAFSDAYYLPTSWFTRDDAYYYFKVAQNISEGHGSSFDGINPTNGYHPLWMLVCIPIFSLARFDLILPLRVLVLVLAVLNAGTAVMLFRLLRGVLAAPAAMLASAYWAFDPHLQTVVYTLGLEAGLAAFFIIALLFALKRFEETWRGAAVPPRQIAWIALLATLAALSRLDLIFLAALAGLWIILRGHPLRYLLIMDLPLLYLSTVLAFILRSGLGEYYAYSPSGPIAGLAAVALKVPILYFAGLYNHSKGYSMAVLIRRSLLAVTTGTAALASVITLLHRAGLLPVFPRTALALDWVMALGAVILVRGLTRWFSQNPGPARISPMTELRGASRAWLREALIFYGGLLGSVGLYMIWNRLTFGTYTPVSGQIKYWWGALGKSVYGGPPQNLLAFLALDPKTSFNAWPLLTPIIQGLRLAIHDVFGGMPFPPKYQAVLGILLCALFIVASTNAARLVRTSARAGLLLLATASVLQIFTYTSLPYASVQEWYWMTELILTILVGAFLVDRASALLVRIRGDLAAGIVIAWLLSGLMLVRLGTLIETSMPYGRVPDGAAPIEAVSFLEEASPPGAIIGMTGGGNIGYLIHDRTIVNMDGLINSNSYFLALKEGKGADYLYQHGLRYVFASTSLLKLPPYQGQFNGRLIRLASLGGKSLTLLLPAPEADP